MKPFDPTTLWLTLSTFEPPCPVRVAQTLAVWLNRMPRNGCLYLFLASHDRARHITSSHANAWACARSKDDLWVVMENGCFMDTSYATLKALYGVLHRYEGDLL